MNVKSRDQGAQSSQNLARRRKNTDRRPDFGTIASNQVDEMASPHLTHRERIVPNFWIIAALSNRLSDRSEQIPGPRDALQVERAALHKLQSGARDQIGDDARHQYFVST
jgi:hypothetical protein